jgi:pyruvate/2-oxoglutarate dehydrogenase complex dihydrolipoamide acyltransferase (E2) component
LGRAVAAHPEVHAYRDWLGRLVLHHHVDVTTMVEVDTRKGSFPLAHPVRDTDVRSVSDLTAELRKIKSTPDAGRSGRMLLRWGEVAGRVPGLVWLVYFIARRSAVVRSELGTVSLSSVGMMIGGSGFAIGVMTLSSLQVLVGGATERPWVVNGEVGIRRILDVTVQIDHKVVDGGPAARFGATLRKILEDPALVDW